MSVMILDSQFCADVAELVDALDLGSSVFDVRVRVSSSAYSDLVIFTNQLIFFCIKRNSVG